MPGHAAPASHEVWSETLRSALIGTDGIGSALFRAEDFVLDQADVLQDGKISKMELSLGERVAFTEGWRRRPPKMGQRSTLRTLD